jgi:hypothetical protein
MKFFYQQDSIFFLQKQSLMRCIPQLLNSANTERVLTEEQALNVTFIDLLVAACSSPSS